MQKCLNCCSSGKMYNSFTLSIKDKEIQERYQNFRVARFNTLFWPLTTWFIVYAAFRFSIMITKGYYDIDLFRILSWFVPVIVWAIMMKCKSKHTPLIMFCWPAINVISLLLDIWGVVPEHIRARGIIAQSIGISQIIFSLPFNYNSFRTSVIGFTLILLPGVYFETLGRAHIYHNHLTGRKYTEREQQAYVNNQV